MVERSPGYSVLAAVLFFLTPSSEVRIRENKRAGHRQISRQWMSQEGGKRPPAPTGPAACQVQGSAALLCPEREGQGKLNPKHICLPGSRPAVFGPPPTLGTQIQQTPALSPRVGGPSHSLPVIFPEGLSTCKKVKGRA